VTVSSDENRSEQLPKGTKVAAVVSTVMGCTGIAYWIPALAGAPPSPGGSEHPLALLQPVLNLAKEQYPEKLQPIIPLLGVLFTLASVLQIPGGLGSLSGRRWAMLLLRTIAYAKVALYITSGLLLGLAIFSNVETNRPTWTYAAWSWVGGFVLIAIYYGIILVMNRALIGDNTEEPEEEDEEPRAFADPLMDRHRR
jgi:hypothetical protein